MTAQLMEAIVSGTPGITLAISAKDLKEALTGMVRSERQRIDEEIERRKEQFVIPQAEVAAMLKTTRKTLLEWEKTGYLVPKRIGRRVYYRQSDIENINTPNT